MPLFRYCIKRRGFVVVAADVRKLADHSKMVVDEILTLSLQGL